MWHCSQCGKSVEDDFEVCWNCGQQREGELPGKPSTEPESACSCCCCRGNEDRIVELCSAANAVEAQEWCNVLEEAGISAQVVGDVLGNAAGGIPLGESTTPRIWVYEKDVAKAREILAQPPQTDATESEDAFDADAIEEEEEEQEEEEQESPIPSDQRSGFLGQGFYIVALASVLIGSAWAFQNWQVLSKYSAIAEGRCVDAGTSSVDLVELPGANGPFDQGNDSQRVFANAYYAYAVDGHVYHAGVHDKPAVSDNVQIHYDPKNPSACVIGPIMPPWLTLVFAFGLGAIMTVIGYQFR